MTRAERVEYDELESDVAALDARIGEVESLNRANEARSRMAETVQPEPTPEGERRVRVGEEAKTYRPDTRHSFFADVISAKRENDYGAQERLNRHRDETRDVGTSAFGDGLVPPAYLPEMYAEVLRAGRPTANVARGLTLTDRGMSITIPRGTTGTAVLQQTSENTEVAETNFDETDLVVPVRTYAGQQDVSRQALDRGVNTDQIIFADLMSAYNTKLNLDVLTGPGTNGRHTGILSTTAILTVTASGTTAAALYRKIIDGAQQVNSTRFEAPTVLIMHPRRWGYFLSQVDADGRPLYAVENGGMNVPGSGEAAGYGAVGTLANIPVITDASIPTTESTTTTAGATEDRIIVAKSTDLLLWEQSNGTFNIRFDETLAGQLTSKLVVAGYSAFTAGWHPEGVRIIVGPNLTTPTF